MKTIAMVVVLYGKSFGESKTLESVMKFEKQLDNLLIVNNGPDILDINDPFLLELSKKHQHVEFENQIQNKPLSWIYNDFINSTDSDYYVLFDDDTEINNEFENSLFDMDGVDLELPKIISMADKNQYYPKLNGELVFQKGLIKNSGDLFSIGSGLIISNKIKKIFLGHNFELFDSRFALYGVDFSFFRKLNKMGREDLLISSQTVLNHSLSGAEGPIGAWRAKERLYDEVLTIKYYRSLPYLRLLKTILKYTLKLNSLIVFEIINIYFLGKHPRCEQKL